MHRPSSYSLTTCCSFEKSLNEQKYYRGEDYENILEGFKRSSNENN